MKVLLVTSDVTYLKDNGLALFEELLKESSILGGVVFLRVPRNLLLINIAKLYAAGCLNLANALMKNLTSLPNDKRLKICNNKNIPINYFRNINDSQTIEWVKHEGFDLIINYRTRCIYKKEILYIPRYGCINVHHGLLPCYRGVFCDLYALFENRPAGFSIHRMNEKIDDGKLICTREVNDGTQKDYQKYLSERERVEALEIKKILDFLANNQTLPKVLENTCSQKLVTKNPTYSVIQKMKKKGILL